MSPQKKRNLLVLLLLILVSGLGIIWYFFNMPHRDIRKAKEDYILDASVIVSEYLQDAQKANQKYLAEDGNSKILEVSGRVSDISEDAQGNLVVLLKETNDKAGVSCTFLPEENKIISKIKKDEKIKVKGVIQSGASYDADLDLYENVILNKCTISQK